MVEITLTSKVSGRVIKSAYTPQQLLEVDEIDLVMDLTKCDCQPVGETYVVECNCDDEWVDYELVIGEEQNEVNQLQVVLKNRELGSLAEIAKMLWGEMNKEIERNGHSDLTLSLEGAVRGIYDVLEINKVQEVRVE